ncbi:MAG: type II toxin-antitoxin system death-on-curing family toxin [Neisseria sp.]|nr:type II toxin-antitoxin system death-on-curing family toxin [Neisseria sp.]
MISVELVPAIHETILSSEAGLQGVPDAAKLEGALSRIDSWQQYADTQDIFEIAALYAVAIAKAHAFPDGNKRTALVTMLVYLDLQGISIPPDTGLDDTMVAVAAGLMDFEALALHLQELATA